MGREHCCAERFNILVDNVESQFVELFLGEIALRLLESSFFFFFAVKVFLLSFIIRQLKE